ncbi:MAG: hypothetical protein CMJ21_01090 [Phycisphaerae bacterium]|nr:hypothetical protein [Phycisphaerae bacterium]
MSTRWFVRGDIDGFFGLFVDNLVQLLLIDQLCRHARRRAAVHAGRDPRVRPDGPGRIAEQVRPVGGPQFAAAYLVAAIGLVGFEVLASGREVTSRGNQKQ